MTDPPPSAAGLRHELHHLQRTLQRDLETVSRLRAVQERRPELDRLLADLDHQLERVGRAAVITLVGATGAGKSTLLNALAGAVVAEEGVNRPTTSQPVIYAPRDADLSDLLGANGAAQVVRREPVAENPWTSQVLVDAPDINSVAAEHRKTVSALAERSDVLLVVLHRQSVIEEASVSFLDEFTGRRRLLFVLNRVDELTPEARKDLLAQVRHLAADRWHAADAPVVALSAKEAQSQPNASGWSELCEKLKSMVAESAVTGLRRQNALGTAARIQSLLAEVREETREDLGALPEETAGALEKLAGLTADEVSQRLSLRRSDIAALLCNEAAKRWDGPGGWAMRAGALSTLGLGAGAVLARRNPLIAAGTAAGGLAAGQVASLARKRRLAEDEELLPEPGEFRGWYAQAMSTPRIRAGRLCDTPEAARLPSSEDAREQAVSAVAESWNRLVSRDLPTAAEKSGLRFFRLILDLPVYALAGWVIYKAGEGFLAGSYVGLDFLLNSLLLLIAYLLVTRMIVRRALGVRASRLLREVTARAQSSLRRWGTEASQAVTQESERLSTALDRLSTLEERWRQRLGAR